MRHTSLILKNAAIAGAVLALLAGCIAVPADTGPAAAIGLAARAQHAPGIDLPADAWPAEQWWLTYGDPQLDALIQGALHDNPSLAVVQARIAGAQAALAAERADEGAQVGLATGMNRQRYSANGFFPPPLGGAWYNDANVQLRASYDVDWWGKHRSLVAAALGETNVRRAEAAQSAQAIAASVAQSYFRLQMLWARQDNVNALAAVQRELVDGRKARIAHGLASSEQLASAELDLGVMEEQAKRLNTQAGREREVLRALIGGDTQALAKLARVKPAPGVNALPRELGMELLARRPDLQAARWRVEAQLGRVAASEAAFRPDINLVGALGLDAVSLGKLLRWPSRTPLIGATLDLPLFDSGRLKAQLGVARSNRDELVSEYNEAVLAAVRDVAQEGATLQGLEQESRAHQLALDSSRKLVDSAEARMKRGLLERAGLLQARMTLLRQQDTDLQLLDARLQTQVALVKALGGGYRATPDNASASASNNIK
ncbi:efflux transporter outer membrane subunit [Massilia sp. LXY-6]|uniref:efflux transporter outer membrane subunit n=1 Tax=Massilia sp. LXY-6 TaxID=3379823 RepID=UPI003EE277BD